MADELITDASDIAQEPPPYDTTVAHPARVYNYWLGGKDNFEADREVGEQTKAAYPEIVSGVRAQRAFLASAVRYLVAQRGVRQFLDVGTGLPAAENTHEVAQSLAPESRVVYVDNDPIPTLANRHDLRHTTQPRYRGALGRGGHVGLGFVLRQQFETPRGRIGNTGTMLRWYPGNGRYALPNWKVSLHESGRDIGPDGQGYPTPQSAYWNQPGTPEEIFDLMNGGGGSASNSGEGPTPNSGNDDSRSGTDDTGPCACGGTDPEPFGSDDDPLDFGLF